MRKFVFVLIFLGIGENAFSQLIVSDRVVDNQELVGLLKADIRKQIASGNEISESDLAEYFRQKFSERFFYDYQSFAQRLPHYNAVFNKQEDHAKRALDHMGKYADSTLWKLPFNYLNGEPVNAYALRHLARQHKMVDIALHYFNTDKDPKYIQYFENQMGSLNAALETGEYEKIEDGNGVYEAFRSGYRILNWLWIHNMFLNEPEYSDQDQLTTIATLLQHGQHLYEDNDRFVPGNHQTRGMSALAMLAILLRDFRGTDLWMDRSMLRLKEHIDKEVNDDGFQFERTVHYHMSDINNYYYVYQLAKLNDIPIDQAWEEKLRGLFTTLVKVAYPDRTAPVLQDDTEIPWAEKNDISGAMTLGYLLFEDPEFGYFATDKVDDRVYWFLSNDQIKMLENIQRKQPTYGSLSFDDTGYFIMREGWDEEDKMMIVSAGLDEDKPDHQHGDMLGIQAIANGHVILPNYQVRYSLEDYGFFKNSMVKNVALVDDQLQGKNYTSNRGGSGFGKFKGLPNPEVIAWETNDHFDFFAGRHDGFKNIGVTYTRQVIFVNDEFWIVKDDFNSENQHNYKQVWQGHYTVENGPGLLRSFAPDASGHDILQLMDVDTVMSDGTRGKQWRVIVKENQKDFSFLTVIYPYKGYSNRLDENSIGRINDWKVGLSEWELEGDAANSLSSDSSTYVFDATAIKGQKFTIQAEGVLDVFIKRTENQLFIYSLDSESQSITLIPKGKGKKERKTLEPGSRWVVDY
ncbi:MAG: heparinase II/III family protein [Reichenbachiella sp.]|uniref:heparinase II/III family protein n=1 Tax=Reichenbachiella sp. TaxID=2184521 RepID=UPI0032988E4C